MTERKLVPNIRFKGFEEDWEKLKLKSCVDRIKGNDGRMDLPTLTISASNGWMSQKERFSSNIAGKERKNYTLLKKGELAYNHGNSRLAPYGTVFELKNYKEALVPRVYHSFKTKFMIKADFLEYLFHSKKIDQELRKLITSGARMDGLLNISYDSFTSITVKAPNTSEQQKIGNLFAKLDRLLDLQQQKLDQLELLKKVLLQKLFPKKDAKIPELRFRDFDDEWKTLKFLNFVEKNSQKNKDLSNTNVESISNKTGFTKQSEQFDGYRVASSDLSNYYVIKEKQFAYNPSRINVGSIAYKKIGEKESVVSPLYVSFSTKSNINNQFLWFWFKTQLFTKQRTKLSEGGVRDTLPFENLKQMHIKAPKISEQQKIGNLLAKVDRLIELENKKFSILKLVKKSLLQNMFVE